MDNESKRKLHPECYSNDEEKKIKLDREKCLPESTTDNKNISGSESKLFISENKICNEEHNISNTTFRCSEISSKNKNSNEEDITSSNSENVSKNKTADNLNGNDNIISTTTKEDIEKKTDNTEIDSNREVKFESSKEDKLDSSKVDKFELSKEYKLDSSKEVKLSSSKEDTLDSTKEDIFNSSKEDTLAFTKEDKFDSSREDKLDLSKEDKPKLDFEGIPTMNPDGTPILFNGVEIMKLTKTQLKKYKRKVKWEGEKKEKRAKERQKMKQKIIEAKLENKDLGPSRKALKRVTMATSSCKINVVIDMSFEDLMINKDIGKVIKQTLRMYTKNRRSFQPMQLHLTSFEGKYKEEMAKHDGYENWDLNFHQVPYLDIFPKDKLVYLSSESENVITKLEDDKVYIIGGLVDHNSHKGVCHKKAVEQGISHGQLPISEYFHFKTRKVFTINQVFEILLEVSQGKTFKEAFELSLPKRINMQPKEGDEDSTDAEAVKNEDL